MTIEDTIEIKKQPSVTASIKVNLDYPLVVGISLSRNRANCSFSYAQNPLKVFSIHNWKDKENQTPFIYEDDELKAIYPTTLKYTKEKDTFLLGNQIVNEFPASDIDLNVHDMISDHLSGQARVDTENLNIDRVLSIFFEDLLKKANEIFQVFAEEEEASFLSNYKKTISSSDNQALERLTQKYKFSLGRCRFCITGNQDQEYKNLIRKAFVNAGLIKETDPEDRLMLTTDSEAFGYRIISSIGYEDQFKFGRKYIFSNISYNLVNFAEIYVDATESTSTVLTYSLSNAPDIQGWNALGALYRKYLLENNSDDKIISDQLEDFRTNLLNGFEFDEAIRETVFNPFIETVLKATSTSYDDDEKIDKIIYFGDLVSNGDINDRIEGSDKDYIIREHLGNNFLSEGAVACALKMDKVIAPSTASTNSKSQKPVPVGEDKPITKEDYDYIIGMDFGTTNSGCSFASTTDRDITPVWDWPPNPNAKKVPTLLIYNEATGKLTDEWGFKAKDSEGHKKKLIRSFKLLISPSIIEKNYFFGNRTFDTIRSEGQVRDFNTEDLIADYIARLDANTKKKIQKTMSWKSKLLHSKPRIKYILTVPCMWNETAKTTMLQAAIRANLASREEDITIITEPEAAALNFDDIIKKLSPTENQFIVCDAGGGTVDLVTYSTAMIRGKSSIQQVGEGCGGLCGSDHINTSFRSYLKKCFAVRFNHDEEFRKSIEDDFEEKKKKFTGEEDIEFSFSRRMFDPKLVKSSLRPDSRCQVNRLGKFIVPCEDIKELFDEVVKMTLDLLTEEFNKTKDTNRVKNLLLVGGFSQSIYLQNEVEKWCDDHGIQLAPAKPAAPVADGAVSYGLDPRLVTRKTAGQSYALLLDKGNGIKKFDYFIKKGDNIPSDFLHLSKRVTFKDSENMIIAIFANEGNDTPSEFNSSFSKVLEIRLDAHRRSKKAKTADICLKFNATRVDCYVEYDQELMFNFAEGPNQVSYKLRYPGITDHKNAMEILKNANYILSSRDT